jgi:hypothetical protein
MIKINFEDLPSQESPINAENLNKLQDNVEEAINDKSIMTVYLKNSITIDGTTTTWKTVIDTLETSVGKNLTFNADEGQIICQKDGYVKVSGAVAVASTKETGNIRIDIQKNGESLAVCPIRKYTTLAQGFNVATKVLQVQANDDIRLVMNNWSGSEITVSGDNRMTYLTVEYV